MALVEVVPNISEARRPDLVDRLVEAATPEGTALLDLHTDSDHNRSVLTLAARSGAEAARAATELARACLAAIDIRHHAGVHPRLGALDVCPFVQLDPPEGTDALEAATACAGEISALGIPVFFYGGPAMGNRMLPEIRRHAFEKCRPDMGPPEPHPTAGSTAVGVRGLLVAYNVIVGTRDRETAARIAAEVREAGGGPPGVRALALWLPSAAVMQISMNLTEPSRCGIGGAWRAVEDSAHREGVEVLGAELVGLVPEVALEDAGTEILSRSGVTPDRVLENALSAAGLTPPEP